MPTSEPRRRAQSAVIGFALMLVLTVALVGVLLVIGTDATTDTSRELDVQRAEQTLTQFDSKSAMVALGSTNSQSVELARRGDATYNVRPDRGWLRVSITNRSSGNTTTLMNVTLGALTYESEEGTIAYQGGGVWKRTDGGTSMVSPPEFHYRNATLTLPVILVRGEGSVDGNAVVRKSGPTKQMFPNATRNKNWTNPLEDSRVNVTVHSDYYRAWGSFFEQRTEGSVAFDDDNGTTTITLITPTQDRVVKNALAATSAGGEIRIAGTGARTDSYTSYDGGTYASTSGSNGSILTAGDVYVGGSGEVQGSIVSGKSVQVTGSGYVDGDVFYTTSEKVKESQVNGTVQRISGVEGASAVDSFVDTQSDAIESSNDNGATSVIDDEELDFSGTATLDPGDYYLDNLTVDDGNTLVLDTQDENISIAVNNYTRLEDNGTIEVRGSGRVNIYIRGNESDPISKADFTIRSSGGTVEVPDENSTMLWVYGKRDFEARIEGSSSTTQIFEGVFYAPGGSTGSSSLYVKHGEVFGGAVAATVEIDQGGAVHFDRALTREEVLPQGTKIIRVTFLHVTTNRINITSG